jgi:alpha-L-fucosidase
VQETPAEYGGPGYAGALAATIHGPLVLPERTPEETARMVRRHRQQLEELLTHYGKIDLLCLDMHLGKDAWPEMRATVRRLRELQPEVMLRIRGIGNYGDYYTPEGFVPGTPGNTDMPWMVIYPLARYFSFDPDGDQYKGGAWIIRNLVDAAAKGGNFMVGIGPDGTGAFHPQAIGDLEEAGEWLKVNGEAIYATRPRDPWQEGGQAGLPEVRFTRTKDGRCIYGLALAWPGKALHLETAQPAGEARVTMLGFDQPLPWRKTERGMQIEIPEALQEEQNRPCKFSWAFKIEPA